jgi:hypothetical protein
MASTIIHNVKCHPDIVGDVQVDVDLDKIGRELGWKAMRNKSGKSRYLKGAVVIKCLSKRKG